MHDHTHEDGWHGSIPWSFASFSSSFLSFLGTWWLWPLLIHLFIRHLGISTLPTPNTFNQELRLNQFTSFCNIFHYLTKPLKVCETMGFYSKYYYEWNVLHVEGICDVIDFILLTAIAVSYYMNPLLPRTLHCCDTCHVHIKWKLTSQWPQCVIVFQHL